MSMVVTLGDEVEQENTDDTPTEAQLAIDAFWPKVMEEMKKIKSIEPGNQILPLARIKKIMKLDEDVKMISAEAPLLFAKACETFIHEITLRAWLHTDDNKRRTLQRNDIAMAISKYDQFDFLIDIVPRDEIKPKKEDAPQKASTSSEQPQQVVVTQPPQQTFQISYPEPTATPQATQQQQQQQQQPQQQQATIQQIPQQTIQAIQGNQLMGTPMIIPIQATQGAINMQHLSQQLGLQAQAQQQLQQQMQQQHINCILPSGEIAQIPLSFIRAQLGGALTPAPSTTPQPAQHGQPIIIQPQHLNLSQLIPQAAGNQIFQLATPTAQHTPTSPQQQQQQQQVQQQQVQQIQLQSPQQVQQQVQQQQQQQQQQSPAVSQQ